MKLTGYSSDDVRHSYPLGEPTLAPPGTMEKLEVMITRFAAGKSIFHPLDNLIQVKENVCVRLLVGGVRESNNLSSGRMRKSRKRWEHHEPAAREWL